MSDYSAMELLFSAIEKPISQLTLCDFLPKKITHNQLQVKRAVIGDETRAQFINKLFGLAC